MTEAAVDDTITDDEQTPQEYLDELAAKAGRMWLKRFPEGRDW